MFKIVLFASDLDDEVGPKIKHQLVLSKERVLRQLNERGHTLLIVEYSRTFRNEVHLRQLLAMTDNGLAGLIDPAVHTHDELVLESNISVEEKAIEVDLE